MNTEELHLFLVASGVGVVVLILLLIVQISIMRAMSYFSQKKRKNIISKFRPLFVHAAIENDQEIPEFKKNEWCYLAEEWNRLIGVLRGEARERLIEIAWRLNMHEYAQHQLHVKGTKNRLFAIVTLGHMRVSRVWNDLVRILNSRKATVSLVAAQALIQINLAQALKVIIPQLEYRDDWHWAGLAHVFRLADNAIICQNLEQLMSRSSEQQLPGMLRLVDAVGCNTGSVVLTEILKNSGDDKVISTCLHVINDPLAIPYIRNYVKHPRWHVRMHAATAVGRLGLQSDVSLLIESLQDSEWWVRYRAAQALVSMPFMNNQMLEDIYNVQQDLYAKDILKHVMSERKSYAV